MSIYFTSVDPEVIATINRNAETHKAFLRRVHDWAGERGSGSEVFLHRFAGSYGVRGLPRKPEGFGRWTTGKVSKPFTNNTAETEAMRALSYTAEEVPGLPSLIDAVTNARDGSSWWMFPSPFVHEGRAWLELGHQPEGCRDQEIGVQWVECLASQYHAAKEAA